MGCISLEMASEQKIPITNAVAPQHIQHKTLLHTSSQCSFCFILVDVSGIFFCWSVVLVLRPKSKYQPEYKECSFTPLFRLSIFNVCKPSHQLHTHNQATVIDDTRCWRAKAKINRMVNDLVVNSFVSVIFFRGEFFRSRLDMLCCCCCMQTTCIQSHLSMSQALKPLS